MARGMLGRNLIAIDVGTTKICVLVAEVDSSGSIEILGMGQYPSHGLKRGVVVNINETVNSIKKAVKEAEAMSGAEIDSAIVGISGSHIKSFNSKGVVAVRNKNVTQYDIDRVVETAKAVVMPEDREIIHVFPQYFRVDGQEYIQDSLGMHGIRLESQVHIITGAISSAQNIIKSCEMAGVQVSDIVLEQIASADAVLTPTEKKLGVGILDIGGGTSDFAIYKEGGIRHSKVLPIAGNHFTSDLAIGLGVPLSRAEELKKIYGFVAEDIFLEFDRDKIDIELSTSENKTVDLYSLFEILEPRAQEVLNLIKGEVDDFRLKSFMPMGLVLTGGGSLLKGMDLVAHNVFGIKARVGIPIGYSKSDEQSTQAPDILKSPIYSTAYGLLIYALKEKDNKRMASKSDSLFGWVFKSMKSWVYDFL